MKNDAKLFLRLTLACLLFLGLGACNSKNDPDDTTGTGGTEEQKDTTVNTGDDDGDFVENVTWGGKVEIAWSGSTATVTNEVEGVTVENTNGCVTVSSTTKKVEYVLSGTGTGQLNIYSDYKFKLSLNSLNLTSADGPAVNNQCHKSCYVVLTGSNSLADGSAYAESEEDRKAAFFSEGQLLFSGTGSLSVTGNYKHALASDDYIRFREGTLTLTANVSDAMHANDGIIIDGGSLTLSAACDGMQCDTSSIVMTGGTVSVTQAGDKGILAYSNVEISGGTLTVKSVDKGIKSAAGNIVISGNADISVTTTGDDGKGILAKSGEVQISGGKVSVSTSGSDAKGIKSVGDMTISGGEVTVVCSGGNSGGGQMWVPAWGGSGGPGGGQGGPNGGFGGQDGPGNMGGGSSSAPEGIESKAKLTISGGTVYAQSSDDAVNSGSDMTISGGMVCAYSTGNDGLDANGNLYIKGGTVYAIGTSSPEVAVDANTEGGYKLYLTGGTVVAIGGLESGSSLTQACYSSSSWSKNTWYALYADSKLLFTFKTPSSAGSALVVSAASTPVLMSGVTVTDGTQIFNGMGICNATVSGGSNVTLSSYTGGNGGMGGGGNGRNNWW